MKSLTALLATNILLAGIGASDAAVRIVEDLGGRIETYVDKYKGVRSSGEMVMPPPRSSSGARASRSCSPQSQHVNLTVASQAGGMQPHGTNVGVLRASRR
jgi:hypothetical protein